MVTGVELAASASRTMAADSGSWPTLNSTASVVVPPTNTNRSMRSAVSG